MYFDFWDNRPDTPRLSSPMTPREKGLATIVVHLLLVILILVWPEIPWVKQAEARRQQKLAAIEQRLLERQRENARFVFMQPKVDIRAEKPPPRAELSDIDRRASSVERARDPKNSLPFARGNTTERIDSEAAPGPRVQPEPTPPPSRGSEAEPSRQVPPLPESTNGLTLRRPDIAKSQTRGTTNGVLADAIRNIQKYAGQESFDNQNGGAPDQNFPSIQFDAKGVEFGPWLRRFVAQIRRNWFIPYAAMTMKGHVVVTFNVHKDGRITDLSVVKPSGVAAFTNSAHNAIAASNPTVPLPPEYPDDRAFFTVTFYFNETPPR